MINRRELGLAAGAALLGVSASEAGPLTRGPEPSVRFDPHRRKFPVAWMVGVPVSNLSTIGAELKGLSAASPPHQAWYIWGDHAYHLGFTVVLGTIEEHVDWLSRRMRAKADFNLRAAELVYYPRESLPAGAESEGVALAWNAMVPGWDRESLLLYTPSEYLEEQDCLVAVVGGVSVFDHWPAFLQATLDTDPPKGLPAPPVCSWLSYRPSEPAPSTEPTDHDPYVRHCQLAAEARLGTLSQHTRSHRTKLLAFASAMADVDSPLRDELDRQSAWVESLGLPPGACDAHEVEERLSC